jgi:hypothetical protein
VATSSAERSLPTKRLTALIAPVLLALALPAAAHAHGATASVSCTAANYKFYNFQPGSNTVHYKVTADDVTVASGSHKLSDSGGTAGSLHVPLKIYGKRTVKAYAWWGPAGTVHGHTRPADSPPVASKNVTCMEAPPAPTAAPAPAQAAPAAPTPAPTAAPGGEVAGVQAQSPARVAGLRVPERCESRTVQIGRASCRERV